MNRWRAWRDRRWGGPAFPRVERPGRDSQFGEWLTEREDDGTHDRVGSDRSSSRLPTDLCGTGVRHVARLDRNEIMPLKWFGSGPDKDPEKRIQDALDDEDGFGGPFTKDQQKEKIDRRWQERQNREKGK